MIAEKMRQLGMHVIDPVLRIQYQPVEKDLEECKRLGKDIAVQVKRYIRRKEVNPSAERHPLCMKSRWAKEVTE